MLLVVADHLIGKPSGGFIGVDVFFVISGYLITGLLLREHDRSGRISFVEFYKRRLKRTLPAALLVILTTVIVGWFLLSSYQFRQVLIDGLASATFLSNWRFIAVGTDYLHSTDLLSPLQHFWSLAIEEQFYLVWPAVLVLALVSAKFRRWPLRRTVGIVLGTIAAASFAWAMWETSANPTTAYFSTTSRVWELAAGGILAASSAHVGRIPLTWRTPISWAGLALVAVAAAGLGPDSSFPGPTAVVPVLGAILVLAAGEGVAVRDVYPLTNPASQYIGKLSYSIYLWHFPVIVLGALLLPGGGRLFLVLSLALTGLLSVMSYHWVEEPFRSMRWRLPSRSAWKFPLTSKPGIRFLGLALCVIAVSSVFFVMRGPVPTPAAPLESLLPLAASSASELEREAAIDDAISAAEWPNLVPEISALGDQARVPEWAVDGCLNGGLPQPETDAALGFERCIYGDRASDEIAVLYGDSVAISYLPAVRASLPGWRIDVLTIGQCPATESLVNLGDGSSYPGCEVFRTRAKAKIEKAHPDLLIVSSSTLSVERLASHASGSAATEEWQAGTQAMVSTLAPMTDKLVILDAPPLEASPQYCKTPISRPSDCVAKVTQQYVAVTEAQRAGARAAKQSNVIYPKNITWFCSRAGECPSFIGATVTLADGMHLTELGSLALSPLLKPYLE